MTRSQLVQHIKSRQSYLCVGLDTDPQKLPIAFPRNASGILAFNKAIIDATSPYCVAFKVNTAFFEALGSAGWQAMEETFAYIPSSHFTIADAKRGDIGNTSHQYARAFFETLGADAITVAPYMGEDSIRPFLEYAGKFTIVLGLTSNSGSHDFQMLKVKAGQYKAPLVPNVVRARRGELLYERVIKTVAGWGSADNLMFVAGATQASLFTEIRQWIPNHFLLVPGIGAQGGSLQDVSRYGMNAEAGLLVNASRAILYASSGEDFAEAAANVARQYAAEMAACLSSRQVI